MPDSKVSQLTGVTGAIAADYFPMVDSSITELRRITKSNLFGDPGPIGGSTACTGVTLSGGVSTSSFVNAGGGVTAAGGLTGLSGATIGGSLVAQSGVTVTGGVSTSSYLHVGSGATIAGGLRLLSGVTLGEFKFTATPAIGYILSSDASGKGSWTAPS